MRHRVPPVQRTQLARLARLDRLPRPGRLPLHDPGSSLPDLLEPPASNREDLQESQCRHPSRLLAAAALLALGLAAPGLSRPATAQAAVQEAPPPAAVALPATAPLQPAEAVPAPDRLKHLEESVEELRGELAALRRGAAAQAEAAHLAEVERRVDVLAGEIERMKIGEAAATADRSTYSMGPAASKVYRTERGLSIGGYGELAAQRSRPTGAADRPGIEPQEGDGNRLDLRRAVVYVGYKWNDRWLFNSELEYEHVVKESSVEFAYVDYRWRREANFRAGLLLVPMGLLSELHEPTVYLGVDRPGIEQVILPTTWKENGVGVTGEIGPVSYRSYLMAGLDASGFAAAGLRDGRQEGIESKAGGLAWVSRVDVTPLPGLLAGGSFYTGDSSQGLRSASGFGLRVPTRIVEGHLEWKWRGLELRALGARATLGGVAALDEALGLTGAESIGERMGGGYVQLGYDLLAGRGGQSLTPFGRWEAYNTQQRVPAGFATDPANRPRSLTLGLAWKPLDQVVLKLDHTRYDRGASPDQFHALLGYIF